MSKIKLRTMLTFMLASTLALGILGANSELDTVEASSQPVERIQGGNRFETASLISSERYEKI